MPTRLGAKRFGFEAEVLRENGLIWWIYWLVERAFARSGCRGLQRLSGEVRRRRLVLEDKHGRPGANSVRLNRRMWKDYSWDRGGEEWNRSSEWRASVVDHLLTPFVPSGSIVLEIGPGAGRWSSALQPLAEQLILVDVSDACIDLCKERLRSARNVEYHVNDGCHLGFIPDSLIDRIWSFDVFVHIAPPEVDSYLGEFARVLSAGGLAAIHHAGGGDSHGGWRSRMTTDVFNSLLSAHGLELVEQFDSWGPGGTFDVRENHDVISVFRRS